MIYVMDSIFAHAEAEYPRECCGLVIISKGKEVYMPCRNIADRMMNEFVIHPDDYCAAAEKGTIIKVVHSHPRSNAIPSQADLVGIETSQLPWVIVNPKTKQMTETLPTGYKAPLVGRSYSYGVLDCFSLFRDYYKEVLSIDLPDIDREGYSWESGKHLFLENYKRYGFVRVDTLQLHDVIVIFNAGDTPNHFGIYVGNGNMLHHSQGRLSSIDVYGNCGYWYKHTWGYIRHVDLLNKP